MRKATLVAQNRPIEFRVFPVAAHLDPASLDVLPVVRELTLPGSRRFLKIRKMSDIYGEKRKFQLALKRNSGFE